MIEPSMRSLVLPIIMSIAWCCYLEGNVALLRYSYYDNDANEILGKEIFLWRASRVHHDKDDAADVDVMRCWRKLGNYIDRGSLREGVIQKETVGHDLLEFRYHIIVKYSYLSSININITHALSSTSNATSLQTKCWDSGEVLFIEVNPHSGRPSNPHLSSTSLPLNGDSYSFLQSKSTNLNMSFWFPGNMFWIGKLGRFRLKCPLYSSQTPTSSLYGASPFLG